jgi:anti-sigma factor (TIGR02949 family)
MDCIEVMRQLWDYLDGELTDERMEAIRAHLAMCQGCHPHFDFERAFLEAIAASCREHQAPGTLRRKVLATLRAAGYAGAWPRVNSGYRPQTSARA